MVDPSGARRWIVRVTVKGQKNKQGAPLRTDFGLGGADTVTLNMARERALEYRRMAKQGLNPRYNTKQDIPTFEEFAQQVHIERLPTWKNAKHGQQWINTLRDYLPLGWAQRKLTPSALPSSAHSKCCATLECLLPESGQVELRLA